MLLPEMNEWLEENKAALCADLRRLIRIPSIARPGEAGYAMGPDCAACADAVMEIGARMGFHTENDDYYCVSLLLPGESPEEYAVLGHMDVVPAGDGWSFPPFCGSQRGEWVLGRGADDNKGACVMALYALKYIREKLPRLPRTLRLIFGFQEESGMGDVRHYLTTHPTAPKFTLVCDGCWPAISGEKGALKAVVSLSVGLPNLRELTAGEASNSVPALARAVLDLPQESFGPVPSAVELFEREGATEVRARGVAAHAAFPQGGVNAAALLFEALSGCRRFPEPARDRLGRIASILRETDGRSLGIAACDELSGPTTCVASMVRWESGRLFITFDARYTLTQDALSTEGRFREQCRALGFTVEELTNSAPRYTNPELPLVKGLIRMANEHYGLRLQPIVMGGGTYAKVFPRSLPFGLGFFDEDSPYPPSPYGKAHQADEAVSVERLCDALPLYVKALVWLTEENFETPEV